MKYFSQDMFRIINCILDMCLPVSLCADKGLLLVVQWWYETPVADVAVEYWHEFGVSGNISTGLDCKIDVNHGFCFSSASGDDLSALFSIRVWIFDRVQNAQTIRFFHERASVFVAQLAPQFTQPFAHFGVVHFGQNSFHLSTLSLRPNHEAIHWSLYTIWTAPTLCRICIRISDVLGNPFHRMHIENTRQTSLRCLIAF
ncbi:hypothetical protein T08_3780 [Trichinella sp. T8]|nr:hypothetical protein T08_3780 [Trichinella sp. T8]